MQISYEKDKYMTNLLELSFQNYCKEMSSHTEFPPMSKEGFFSLIEERLKDMNCMIYLQENEPQAFLAWDLRAGDEKSWCMIPVWGYGVIGEKKNRKIGKLFQYLAEKLVSEREDIEIEFCAHLYAHDLELQRLFCYMQFGMICESGIRYIGTQNNEAMKEDSNIEISILTKEEIKDRWSEVWELLNQLIGHLRKSPVFYPGVEFTEMLYKEFFMSEETIVYATELDNHLIGILEANTDTPTIFSHLDMVNVGEAFVLPELRDGKAARMMLEFMDNELRSDDIRYQWVQHGTANPNARGFWNKYFTTYEYEMIRSIKLI